MLDSARTLQQRGFDVTYLPVETNGLVNVQQLADSIRDDTALVGGWVGVGGRVGGCPPGAPRGLCGWAGGRGVQAPPVPPRCLTATHNATHTATHTHPPLAPRPVRCLSWR